METEIAFISGVLFATFGAFVGTMLEYLIKYLIKKHKEKKKNV